MSQETNKAELFGLRFEDLPEGVQPVEAVIIVKCLHDDEKSDYPYLLVSRVTDGLSVWEALGMSEWMRLRAQRQMERMGEDEDGND